MTQILGRTSYSYAGGQTRRDLAGGSREALVEAGGLLGSGGSAAMEIRQEKGAEKMKSRLLRRMVM